MHPSSTARRFFAAALLVLAAFLTGGAGALIGVCGPFTDVAADAFCPFVLEVFYLGITTGTTPTTYDPAGNVSRLQMAAFLSRSVDGVLKRGSPRAAMNRFWAPRNNGFLGLTTVGDNPHFPISDGEDIWVSNIAGNTVSRVHASSGKLLETWTGAVFADGIVSAMGRIFVGGQDSPGRLYVIDPGAPAGAVTTVANTLGVFPTGIAFDGVRLWTANQGPSGSVSIVTPGVSIPWTVTTFNVGIGASSPAGALYDGANVWVTDLGLGTLLKLDSTGTILQTVTVGTTPAIPVFDGSNIWVSNAGSDSISVVRASSGAVLATLTGNGLKVPLGGAFDGQRILIINQADDTVSFWKAADLTPLGVIGTGDGSQPLGACSDGVNFWVALSGFDKLARF